MYKKNLFGWIGIALGGIALLLAMIHFYAGPFSPQPTLESLVANKAVAIKQSLVASLAGHKVPETLERSHYNLDRILDIVTVVLGAGAVILGVIGGACKENRQAASGAILLGTGTLYFQFAVFALGAVLVVVLIVAALSLISGNVPFG
ncbi:hypothetical protein C9426_19905 [Serratia sp. S1B]|nr:hypothetical protein C9426_19905 [Serratia sp. S1B]